MRFIHACLLGVAMSGLAIAGASAAPLKIGIVAPSDGDYAILGQQARDGARLAAAEHDDILLSVIDESCEDGSGQAVSSALAEAGVDIAIGFFCSETIRGAMPALRDAGIPALTLSARSASLMETALKEDWPLFRMAPSERDQVDAIVDYIIGEWVGRPVALLDDGTIYFREMVNAVRNALEDRGLEPVLVETFRPAQEQQLALVRRLVQAGITHVFIGGTRSDVAILARDARQQGAAFAILGSDALRAQQGPVPLTPGVLAIALPEAGELPPAADLAERAQEQGLVAEGYFVPAAAAVDIAAEAFRAADGDPARLAAMLTTEDFDTPLGPVAFTEGHELNDNPYFLLRWQGNTFVPVFDSDRP